MKITTAQTYATKKFEVLDKANSKPVSLRIEAAHAGIVNGNNVFYTPRALREGGESLKTFFKPLQKKHFDKTLGYIYDADFEDRAQDSKYRDAIDNAKTHKELVAAVKAYYYSDEYDRNTEGFGVLISKARLYDVDKIQSLLQNDKGYVSIAGDAGTALCSICSGHVVECEHTLGIRYNNEVCFAIADSLELDHISFENIPANFKTNSLIIADSQTLGSIELIQEGNIMSLTIEQLKEKLQNVDNTLTELNLTQFTEQYKTQTAEAKGGALLFPKDGLAPLNTELGLVVAKKLVEQLEEGDNKEAVKLIVEKEYKKLFGETSLEDAITKLVTDPVEADPTPVDSEPKEEDNAPAVEGEDKKEPENKGSVLEVTDANQLVMQIVDSLSKMVDTKLQDLDQKIAALSIQDNQKGNEIYLERIEALEQDLTIAAQAEKQLTEQLKDSLISQIKVLGTIDEEYETQLGKRTVRELTTTLEDHKHLFANRLGTVEPIADTEGDKEPGALVVTDSQQESEVTPEVVVDKESAITEMDEGEQKVLEVTDSNTVITGIFKDLGSRVLSRTEYANLYKEVAVAHGTDTAKQLHTALKQQFKIQ